MRSSPVAPTLQSSSGRSFRTLLVPIRFNHPKARYQITMVPQRRCRPSIRQLPLKRAASTVTLVSLPQRSPRRQKQARLRNVWWVSYASDMHHPIFNPIPPEAVATFISSVRMCDQSEVLTLHILVQAVSSIRKNYALRSSAYLLHASSLG